MLLILLGSRDSLLKQPYYLPSKVTNMAEFGVVKYVLISFSHSIFFEVSE